MKKNMCDPILLNGFIDQELEPEEHARVEEHLENCVSCREAVGDSRKISMIFTKTMQNEVERTSPDIENLVKIIRDDKEPWWMKFKDMFDFTKILVPVTAMAAACLVVYFLNVKQPVPVSGPSAIIDSFTGNISSVMILETPETHRTIIWYNENS